MNVPPKITMPTAAEVIPNLFVGTREDAEALGARVPDDWACLSVTEYRSRYKRTEELPREPDGSLDLPFMTDRPGGWHADHHKLDLIAETIWWKLQQGKKVLVHCIHAQERSPLAIAWYLAWSGAVPSIDRAYTVVSARHPRTERRDQWLRGVPPKKQLPELTALLAAAKKLDALDAAKFDAEPTDCEEARDALTRAAITWAARTR